ncbi:MAG: GTPase, partial [Pirellulales bacterium]
LAQLAGGLARPLHQLRDELLQLLAELEAGLDFVDEDIEFISADAMRQRLESARSQLADVTRQMASRHTSRRRMQVVLVGEPNVGKSSLFNALINGHGIVEHCGQRQSTPALVSPRRGTTRDYLTATIDIDGLQCELVDTAGVAEFAPADETYPSEPLRQPSAIDTAAQALAAEQRQRAAIRACCVVASQTGAHIGPSAANCDILVLTKADQAPQPSPMPGDFPGIMPIVVTSSRTGQGLEDFCAALRKLLTNERAAQHGQIVAATAERCRESVRLADAALGRATEIVVAQGGDELVAAELRTAISELGKVVGTVYTDDLLDRIFSTFCIGK